MDRLTIKDILKVTDIICDDSVLFTAKDDGVTDPYQWVRCSLHNPEHIWLSPNVDTLLLFKPVNYIMFEMHIAIKAGRGRALSRNSCIRACGWIFDNTPCEKLISYINENNELALSLAFECGMEREGLLKEAMMVNGNNDNIVVIGATKQKFNKLHR